MSKIEWTDETWNAIRGCSPVSPGCLNCYAARQAIRMSGPGQPYEGLVKSGPHGPRWTGRVVFDRDKLLAPKKWKKPRMVFANSMSDLFHEELPFEDIAVIFAMMGSCPRHTFQVLTKRPARAASFFEYYRTVDMREDVTTGMNIFAEGLQFDLDQNGDLDGFFHSEGKMDIDVWPLKNVWLGTSCENQKTFEIRGAALRECPAAIRWVSLEPLLGPIDLGNHIDRLDWVVVGGESGPGARPCRLQWVEDIVRQCNAAKVRVFVKQMGSLHSDHKAFDRWPKSIQVREYPEVVK